MGDVDTVLKEGICIDCGSKSFKDLRSIWLLCDECYSLFHVSQTSPIIIVRRTKLQGRSYE
jgi:protein-arginine kinase activator protein McsA